MRRTVPLLTALLVGALPAAVPSAAALPAAASGSGSRGVVQQQGIALDAHAGDGSVGGTARLTVTRESGGFRLRGHVASTRGCVELKAVNMHLGTYLGGDTVKKTCKEGVQERVDSWTRHTDVVLSAIVDHGPDWDSSIVTLTGRP
ncbi:hypothetical protein ACIRBX_04315 [Kitasatospora sp. NPDC096147]|uniref:hypothetical protein n=1 Tax=Kitasatospora sp. NPDC096147 TaxID=3364093 RepID=UPI0038148356